MPNFFYESAPDMLLDKILEVNDLLTKLKAKNGETQTYKFWASVSDVMKLAWDNIMETKFIRERAMLTTEENRFLIKYSRDLQQRLDVYEVIREEMIKGTMEDTVKRVNEVLANKPMREFLERRKRKN
jgi:hypothetical protein